MQFWRSRRRNAILLVAFLSVVSLLYFSTRLAAMESSLESVEIPKSILPTERRNMSNRPELDVHAFYYPWYGNPEIDHQWLHWNHELLPHWDPKVRARYKSGRHEPPDDIGANFYPKLGAYSSRNSSVIDEHMREMYSAGIGVVVVSWYPPGQADSQGKPWDDLIPKILDAAAEHNLRVTFHIEPFEGRTVASIKKSIEYLVDTYGDHIAFYRKTRGVKTLPLFYFYDSYQVNNDVWHSILSRQGTQSIRNTAFDCIAVGLLVNLQHGESLKKAGFDGFYTYFASNEFSYGSTWKHWASLSMFARKNGLMFVPSVGPGYVDTRVRPWNAVNTKERSEGKYYEIAWNFAMKANPSVITITSYNEWHEGTQIESAVPKSVGSYVYSDYGDEDPEFYLKLTRKFVSEWLSRKRN